MAARGVVVEEVKKKKRRRNEDTKGSTPAETPAEATHDLLKRKKPGSKINVEAVDKVYNACRPQLVAVDVAKFHGRVNPRTDGQLSGFPTIPPRTVKLDPWLWVAMIS